MGKLNKIAKSLLPGIILLFFLSASSNTIDFARVCLCAFFPIVRVLQYFYWFMQSHCVIMNLHFTFTRNQSMVYCTYTRLPCTMQSIQIVQAVTSIFGYVMQIVATQNIDFWYKNQHILERVDWAHLNRIRFNVLECLKFV